MITSIYSGSSLLSVSTSSMPYVGSGLSAGQMRLNISTQKMEAYDGVSWIQIEQTVSVSLAPQLEAVIAWWQAKMAEEAKLIEKLDQHPSLRDAYEKFKILEILYREEKNVE